MKTTRNPAAMRAANRILDYLESVSAGRCTSDALADIIDEEIQSAMPEEDAPTKLAALPEVADQPLSASDAIHAYDKWAQHSNTTLPGNSDGLKPL